MLAAMEFAHRIAKRVQDAQENAHTVVSEALKRASYVQEKCNAFIRLAPEALAKAKAIDEKISKGENPGPLAGVPFVVKDNICTKGIVSTAGSQSLASFIPPYSATVVERLESAGAIMIAKTNLDEFGMGSSNEHSAFGAAKNPWDLSRVPGGSSGGSAIAVATGVAPLALGTDTGGSVRQPAGFTGVIGFKPTYGRLSRYGVMAFASSLDQVGVFARSSTDLALAMDVMSGHDPSDATSLEAVPEFMGHLEQAQEVKGLRIGIIRELSAKGNSPGVLAALEKTKTLLKGLGAELEEVSLPHAPYGIATYYLVAPAEASSNLARYDGMIYSMREGENALGQADVMMRSRGKAFGKEVRRRILMGTYALSSGYYEAYYGKALKVRRLIADDFAKAFTRFDLLLSPTSPSVAYPIGEKSADPLAMYLDDVATVLANLAGIAAISVPLAKAEHDLPCGMQFFAPAMQDERLMGVLKGLEQAQGFTPLAAL